MTSLLRLTRLGLERVRRVRSGAALVRRLPDHLVPMHELIRRADEHLGAGRFEELDALVRSALADGRSSTELFRRYAFSAHNSARYKDACERWSILSEQAPDDSMAWSGLAANLRELHMVVRARDVVEQALRRFPDDFLVITEAIRVYEHLGDHETALALWARTCELRPAEVEWAAGYVVKLAMLRRLDEAERFLRDCRGLGAELRPLAEAIDAIEAMARERWEEAETRLAAIALQGEALGVSRIFAAFAAGSLQRSPQISRRLYAALHEAGHEDLYVLHGRVDAAIRCGLLVEAGEALDHALALMPAEYVLQRDQAALAMKRERWDEAITLFERLLATRPTDRDVREQLARCRMDRAFVDSHGSDRAAEARAERQDVGHVHDDALRALLLGFESLGQDCEFGLVQRRYGAEPLGLLRWNAVRPEVLVEALDRAFEGLGRPENTAIGLWDDFEYYVTDTRWEFGFHSWISRHEMPKDAVLAKMCKRLAFLRTKLIVDLAAAEKIFVCKTFDTTADVMRELLAALRRHGPATLLWVRSLDHVPAHHEARAGEIAMLEDGLLAGYVGRFGNRDIGPWNIAFDEWIAVCRAAQRATAAPATIAALP